MALASKAHDLQPQPSPSVPDLFQSLFPAGRDKLTLHWNRRRQTSRGERKRNPTCPVGSFPLGVLGELPSAGNSTWTSLVQHCRPWARRKPGGKGNVHTHTEHVNPKAPRDPHCVHTRGVLSSSASSDLPKEVPLSTLRDTEAGGAGNSSINSATLEQIPTAAAREELWSYSATRKQPLRMSQLKGPQREGAKSQACSWKCLSERTIPLSTHSKARKGAKWELEVY